LGAAIVVVVAPSHNLMMMMMTGKYVLARLCACICVCIMFQQKRLCGRELEPKMMMMSDETRFLCGALMSREIGG